MVDHKTLLIATIVGRQILGSFNVGMGNEWNNRFSHIFAIYSLLAIVDYHTAVFTVSQTLKMKNLYDFLCFGLLSLRNTTSRGCCMVFPGGDRHVLCRLEHSPEPGAW